MSKNLTDGNTRFCPGFGGREVCKRVCPQNKKIAVRPVPQTSKGDKDEEKDYFFDKCYSDASCGVLFDFHFF